MYTVIQFSHGEVYDRAEFDDYWEAWEWFTFLRACYIKFHLCTDLCVLASEEGEWLHTLAGNGELD